MGPVCLLTAGEWKLCPQEGVQAWVGEGVIRRAQRAALEGSDFRKENTEAEGRPAHL